MSASGFRQRLAAILAGAYRARGRDDDARREAREVLRLDPGFRLKQIEDRLVIVKDREMLADFLAMLRQLGLE